MQHSCWPACHLDAAAGLRDIQSSARTAALCMQACIATIVGVQQKHGVTSTSLLNFVVSDGNALVATRFVSPATENAASLYYAEGGALGSAGANKAW